MKDLKMQLEEIPTPALLVDEVIVERNLKRMADYGKQHGLGIRPHTKTHKSVRLARRQVELGAVGLTVAKLGEAELMIEATEDLLVAYPALDPARTSRLTQLAKEKTIRVAIDSAFAVDAIATAAKSAGVGIGILVDIDAGYHRTGVQSPEESLDLAQQVDRTPGVRLDGLMFFPGNVLAPPAKQQAVLAPIAELMDCIIELWKAHGLEAKIVSGGSTPTAYQSHYIPALTEIRPGTYLFNDMNTVRCGAAELADCAARLVCTVVSNAVPGKVVIDAGSKTLTSDRSAVDPERNGFGWVVEYPEARVVRLSEEHGEIDITQCRRSPRLGERVQVIPNHICPCVNLQDLVWLHGPGESPSPLPVDTRGRLS